MKKFLMIVLLSANFVSFSVEDTPLIIAAQGEKSIASFCAVVDFVKKGADVNEAGAGGFTALMKASLSGFLNVIEYLIANGAEVNIQDALNGETALIKVTMKSWGILKKDEPEAEQKFTFIVKRLLEAGADPNIVNEAGQTPLMWAAAYDLKDIIALLLQYGADMQIKAKDGKTVTDFVADPTVTSFIQKLQQGLLNEFEQEILLGNLEKVKQLVNAGADINQVFGVSRFTPIIRAAQEGHLSLVEFLISKNADLNAQDDAFEKETALHVAVRRARTQPAKQKEYFEIVKALLQAKANPNIPNAHGLTPLMVAAASDLFEFMELLLDHKANKKLKDKQGKTAWDLANEKGQTILKTYKKKK